MKSKLLFFIKRYQFIIYFCLAFGILDFSIRLQFLAGAPFRFIYPSPNLFTLSVVLLFLIIYILLPRKLAHIFGMVILTMFSILLFANNIFMDHFGAYFSFKAISQANEGLFYLHEYLSSISVTSLLTVIISIILLILAIKTDIKEKIKFDKIIVIIILIICSGSHALGYAFLGNSEGKGFLEWTKKQYYKDYTFSIPSFSISGLYSYTFRDIYFSLITNEKPDYSTLNKEINEYLDKNKTIREDNQLTGIFKDKNVMFIMLENIDTWMINQDNTPTIKMMMDSGINFNKHYSHQFSIGATFVTEFIANTGFLPDLNTASAAYDYANNTMPNALPNLFKNAGYTTNSYHVNTPRYYNRSTNHLKWGYKQYHGYPFMGIADSEYTQDRYLALKGYDKMNTSNKFFNFLITYSGHMPFGSEKPECKNNLSYAKEHTKSTDINYLCAMAQSHETEIFFENLIKKLEANNKLKDTVIIAFTDHYSYSGAYKEIVEKEKKETITNLKMNTPFFIWTKDIKHIEYNNITSTIDIVPTISNLFGIDYDASLYIGTDAFSKNHKSYVFFKDFSWYDGTNYYSNTSNKIGKPTKVYIEKINSEIQDKINYSSNVLKSDYFRKDN